MLYVLVIDLDFIMNIYNIKIGKYYIWDFFYSFRYVD